MNKIKENINPKINPISKIFAIVLFIATLVYVFLPMVFSFKKEGFEYEINTWFVVGGLTWSFLSLIAPDDFKGVMVALAKKLISIAK